MIYTDAMNATFKTKQVKVELKKKWFKMKQKHTRISKSNWLTALITINLVSVIITYHIK